MINNNKVLSLVGLATKAGKIVSGEFSTEKSVKSGKGFVVLLAEDASDNTKKNFVFSVSGVRMNSVNNLPAGLYIINGKKYIVK